MEEDLDEILASQYHGCLRRLKTIKRLRKIFPYKEDLDRAENQVYLTMQFYENMVNNKSLLNKKVKIKKADDILSNKSVKTFVKGIFTLTNVSYSLMNYYWQSYMSFWLPTKENKNDD